MESQLFTNTQDFETYSNEPVNPVGRLESDGQYFQTLMDDTWISNGGEHFIKRHRSQAARSQDATDLHRQRP